MKVPRTTIGATAAALPGAPQVATPPSDTDELRAFASNLVASGAVVRLKQGAPALVGDFRWDDPNRIVWFAAFGDLDADAHLFSFHSAHRMGNEVVFRHSDGDELGLIGIEHAGLEDPDDYRTAFQLWQQVAPMRADFIGRAYGRLEAFAEKNP
jgi:hypothetical protein